MPQLVKQRIPTTISPRQEDEVRITEFLYNEIRKGLTGEDHPVLFQQDPHVLFHAGVLKANMDELEDVQNEDLQKLLDEDDTSRLMAIDFRVAPSKGSIKEWILSLDIRFSLYFSCIPSLEEALEYGSRFTPNADSNNDEEKKEGQVILPDKYKRKDIVINNIEISIPATKPFFSDMISLESQIKKAIQEIQQDEILRDEIDAIKIPAGSLENEKTYEDSLSPSIEKSGNLPEWNASIYIQAMEESSSNGKSIFRVNLALVNNTPGFMCRKNVKHPSSFFNCGFSINLKGLELVPFVFEGAAEDYKLDRTFQALGTNCVAKRENDKLITDTLPLFRQEELRTTNYTDTDFSLMGSSASNPLDPLIEIASKMDEYLQQWDQVIKQSTSIDSNAVQSARKRDRDAFSKEISVFKLGIECLKRDKNLMKAYLLMNDCFSELGQERDIKSWRLFQIAFIVSQLPSVLAREWSRDDSFGDKLKEIQKQVGVLIFPTGGGKTEAYLGLIVLSLFFDRLRGKGRGLTAWMRFPLRMLSLQQLDRLAVVLAVAEKKRSQDPEMNYPESDPFGIGYYVGSGNTPNRITEKYADYIIRNGYPPLFPQCPFCGSPTEIKMDTKSWRLKHICTNPDCYSNNSEALGDFQESLPIFITDNEIYRYRPSVMVSTVDKLAILAFNKNFSSIILGSAGKCPFHGYYPFERCVEYRPNHRGICSVNKRKYHVFTSPEKDPMPTLVIQDEMHLLNEELGTFAGHYESFIRYVAEEKGYLPPKILGATATIQSFERHMYHLFMQNSYQFPVSGHEEEENFYSTKIPSYPKRFYVGILSHNRSSEDSVVRCLEIHNSVIRWMKDNPSQAISDLGLLSFKDNDDLLDHLHLYDFSLAYVNRKATSGDLEFGLKKIRPHGLAITDSENLERDIISSDTIKGDNSLAEVREIVERIERERFDVEGERLDTLIATSIISHGVDLERINVMCLAGMPSRYAEYIQASSRSARKHAGLVLSCFNRRDLRENAQYQYFQVNHRFLEKLVESVPINRFSAFATRKTVPGLLCGVLNTIYLPKYLAFAKGKDFDDLETLRKAIDAGIIKKEDLVKAIEKIVLGNGEGLTTITFQQTRNAIQEQVEECWITARNCFEYNRLHDAVQVMSSFRDVDINIEFIPQRTLQFIEKI